MGYVRPERAKRPANRPKWPLQSLRRPVWAIRFFEIHDPGAFDEHFFNGLLTVVMTGGGAALPMVQELAKGSVMVRGQKVPVQPALPFPNWLKAEHPELEDDFPRIAVSLGGARKKLIQRGSEVSVTGGLTSVPKLEGYYQRGA